MPRLLIVSFYYPPDLSAGSFRCQALVDAIAKVRGDDFEVDVITTMPNRYHELSNSAPEFEDRGWLTIRRISLPSHKSGMLDQSRAFASFATKAIAASRKNRYDAVFATSSRLMTASLGTRIAKYAGCPLYLDIRDLFADTMGDVLAKSSLRLLLPAFRKLEQKTFSAADRLSIVSAGFRPHILRLVPPENIRIFTNGIDQEFLDNNYEKQAARDGDTPVILYAGNIGEGQGMEHIIPQAAKLLEGKAIIRLVGAGGRLQRLKSAVAAQPNIEILPPVTREHLIDHYREADVLLLHLNDHQAFNKVLPSKLFEYAATGKPVLAGVGGYAAEFITAHVTGASVFSPCSADGMQRAFLTIAQGKSLFQRTEFCEKFLRERIMGEMARDVIQLCQTGRRGNKE